MIKAVCSDYRTRLILLSICLISMASCTGANFRAIPSSEYVALDPDDVVTILSAAGFSDDEIVTRGRTFRNMMAESGTATVSEGKTTIAMFTVRGGLVHISTLAKGSYIYNPKTNELR
jgi:hypothetical protein